MMAVSESNVDDSSMKQNAANGVFFQFIERQPPFHGNLVIKCVAKFNHLWEYANGSLPRRYGAILRKPVQYCSWPRRLLCLLPNGTANWSYVPLTYTPLRINRTGGQSSGTKSFHWILIRFRFIRDPIFSLHRLHWPVYRNVPLW